MYTSKDPRAHHDVYFALVRDIIEGGAERLAATSKASIIIS